MLEFVQARRVSAALVVLTAALFAWSFTVQYPQTQWLSTGYGLERWHLHLFYGVGLLLVALVFAGEPQVRAELRESGALPLVVFVAAAGNVLAAFQLVPSQPQRFVQPVTSISLLLAWSAAVGGGAVLLALPTPLERPSPRIRRYAWAVALVVLVGMLAVHIGSTPHFNRLDDVYDELWAASAMANYATTGNFSPTLAGSPYGDSDPFLARWLLWNGAWAGLWGRTDFATLRTFPTFAGVLLVLMTGGVLWRYRDGTTALGRAAGLALMVSLAAYGRAAHNLRMDIGLAFYGLLVLAFLLAALRREPDGGGRWALVAAGLSLYLGMDTIPTISVMFAFLIGLWVIWRAWAWPLRDLAWMRVLAYLVGCIAGMLTYLAAHFLPDVATNVANFQKAQETYVQMGSIISGSPLTAMGSTHRFSFVLSPVELFVIYAVLLLWAWRATNAERGLLVVIGITQLGVFGLLNGSLGYQMLFVPFLVYGVARTLRTRAGVVVGVMVLLPTMAAAPLNDMLTDWRLQLNQRLIAELDLLTWRVPDGATVAADDLFWLTLHDRAQVYGHSALFHAQQGVGAGSIAEALDIIAPDMVICRPDQGDQQIMCDWAAANFAAEPEIFAITGRTYAVYGPG
jgi:hypothetical protein